MSIRSQRGEATFGTIIAIIIAAILLFIVPLITLADKKDKNDQAYIQAKTDEIAAQIVNSGILTRDMLDNFKAGINSTGTLYEVEMEFKILDENASKKQAQGQIDVIGENTYYNIYTTSIENQIYDEDGPKCYILKEGDIVTVKVTNASKTLADTLRGIWTKISGDDTYSMLAQSTQSVKKDGN